MVNFRSSPDISGLGGSKTAKYFPKLIDPKAASKPALAAAPKRSQVADFSSPFSHALL
jgi:hypothetical protein